MVVTTTESSRTPHHFRRPTLPSLTGARWWAAFAVFVLHALVFLPTYPFQKSETFQVLHSIIPMQLGASGVTFFFVLSGFVIYWSYSSSVPLGLFYRRRILKLYPTHLLAAAVFVVAASVPVSRLVTWVPNVLLVHTWIPSWTTLGGLNVPSWSLCAEVLFYASFPLAFPLIKRIPTGRVMAAIAAFGIGVLLLHTGFYLFADGPKGIDNFFVPRLLPGDVSPYYEIHASPQWFAQADIPVSFSYWLSYTFPLSRLPEFFIGVLAARAVAEGIWRNTRLTLPLLSLTLCFAATYVVPINYKLSALLVLPTAAVIATLAARDLAGIRGINSRRVMIWLGDISFAFYMIQFPVMVLVTRFAIGGREWGLAGWLGWSAVCLILSVIAADLIFRGVDRPMMRTFSGRTPARASVEA